MDQERPVRRWWRASGAAACVVALTVGLAVLTRDSEDAPTGAAQPADLPFAMSEGEVLVSCSGGHPGWRPSVMREGLPGVLGQDEAREAFKRILGDPQMGGEAALSLFPNGIDVDWRVLYGEDDLVVLGIGEWTDAGPTAESALTLALQREDGEWVTDGWSGCNQLSPLMEPGNAWVDVDEYDVPVAGEGTVTVYVSERQCASGRDPSPYLHEPVVVETSQAVTMYWTSEPAGESTCQGNPSVKRTVTLDAPLGDRQLLNGARYPAAQVPVNIVDPKGEPYGLYTHCGIEYLRIDGQLYRRVGGPLTDEGGGNPPPGWDNPVQEGWVEISDGIAVFTDGYGHREEFEPSSEDVNPAKVCM